jgi:carotenoid cleavage dioxygenase-like enzyme
VLCSGVVETLGRVTLGGQWKVPFTAHPKLDPTTGGGYVCIRQGNAYSHTILYTQDMEYAWDVSGYITLAHMCD